MGSPKGGNFRRDGGVGVVMGGGGERAPSKIGEVLKTDSIKVCFTCKFTDTAELVRVLQCIICFKFTDSSHVVQYLHEYALAYHSPHLNLLPFHPKPRRKGGHE